MTRAGTHGCGETAQQKPAVCNRSFDTSDEHSPSMQFYAVEACPSCQGCTLDELLDDAVNVEPRHLAWRLECDLLCKFPHEVARLGVDADSTGSHGGHPRHPPCTSRRLSSSVHELEDAYRIVRSHRDGQTLPRIDCHLVEVRRGSEVPRCTHVSAIDDDVAWSVRGGTQVVETRLEE